MPTIKAEKPASAATLKALAEHVRELGLLTEPGAAIEVWRTVHEAVADASDAAFHAILASGSEPKDTFEYLPGFIPEEAFANADAATCWHLHELAADLSREADALNEAAEWLERASENLWCNRGMKSTPEETELERDLWRQRNTDVLKDAFARTA